MKKWLRHALDSIKFHFGSAKGLFKWLHHMSAYNASVISFSSVCTLSQLVMVHSCLEELISLNIHLPLNTLLHTFLNHRRHRFPPWLWCVLYMQERRSIIRRFELRETASLQLTVQRPVDSPAAEFSLRQCRHAAV